MQVQVLKELPWEEEDVDAEEAEQFINRRFGQCKVFQHGDVINVILELIPPDNSQPSNFACLACNGLMMQLDDHYISHAYLSNAKTGVAVEAFPKDASILGVSWVKREEKDRKWSCSGDMMNDGCTVSGLKFTLGNPPHGSETPEIILHCWAQCNPIPYCGDPRAPTYVQIRVSKTSDKLDNICREILQGNLEDAPYAIKNGVEVGLLPVDYLFTIGRGFCPFDASGMMVLDTEPLRYYREQFQYVKEGLGYGHWQKDGRLILLRKKWSSVENLKLVSVEVKKAPMFMVGLGCIGQNETDWFKQFHEKIAKQDIDVDAITLCGSYESVHEFLTMPEHLMASRELNACVPGRSKSMPIVMCNQEHCKSLMTSMLQEASLTSGAEKFSVRFTAGSRSLFLPSRIDKSIHNNMISGQFKSSVQVGCKGGSLGYHLVTSSEGRNVLTLHGSLEDLLTDLKGLKQKEEINANRELIKGGKVKELLAQRHTEPGDVMALRIMNPSVEAVLACANVVDGRVLYDSKTRGLYPVKYENGGNVSLSVACAVIIEVLEEIQQLKNSCRIETTKIVFEKIF